MTGKYEPGMKVTYDTSSKRVIIAFRGKIVVLPATYDTEVMGKTAGEAHCIALGWNPNEGASRNGGQFRTVF